MSLRLAEKRLRRASLAPLAAAASPSSRFGGGGDNSSSSTTTTRMSGRKARSLGGSRGGGGEESPRGVLKEILLEEEETEGRREQKKKTRLNKDKENQSPLKRCRRRTSSVRLKNDRQASAVINLVSEEEEEDGSVLQAAKDAFRSDHALKVAKVVLTRMSPANPSGCEAKAKASGKVTKRKRVTPASSEYEESDDSDSETDSSSSDSDGSFAHRTEKPGMYIISSDADIEEGACSKVKRTVAPTRTPKPSPQVSRVAKRVVKSTAKYEGYKDAQKSRKSSSKREPESQTPKSVNSRNRISRTPSSQPRMSSKVKAMLLSPLQEAQARLHVSAVPDCLPCRDSEFAEIFAFTESKVKEKGGGCMYISGVPGTGKTATVKEVIRTLKDQVSEGDLEDFVFVEINGMRLTEPGQAYVQIWKQLTGLKASAAHAQELLAKRFSGTNRKATVLLVDELDMLWNRKQTVLYNLFDWPTLSEARLVVLAIANTMDLPEKMMMNRVTSRLGLTRLQFSPYTHQQLQEIVVARLSGLKVFDADAVQLVSRKVASLSGDARRALDICRRATEIAQGSAAHGSNVLVGMQHVTKAHDEMFCSPRIMAIRGCSKYEKVFLQAILECFRRTGIEETSFDRVFSRFMDYLSMSKLSLINATQTYEICMDLAACRIILAESARLGSSLRIWLNVSQDDVVFALETDKVTICKN